MVQSQRRTLGVNLPTETDGNIIAIIVHDVIVIIIITEDTDTAEETVLRVIIMTDAALTTELASVATEWSRLQSLYSFSSWPSGK